MKKLLAVLLLPLGAGATTTILSIDPTATQAIVKVQTDQPGNCTYKASESANLTGLVNDVNTTLFSGSNSDARTGSIVDGPSHIFVLGLRTSSKGLDGKFYSRALEANTQHWVGVTCGSDAEVTRTFQTANPPVGNTYPEPAPFDSQAFGNYAWPSIDWVDRTKSYIDPLTGILLKRMTDAADDGLRQNNVSFSYATGGWTNPSNALSHDPSTTASVADNTSVLFLSLSPDWRWRAGWRPSQGTLTDILVHTYGSASDATGENRKVLVCLSLDSGQTCATSQLEVTLPLSAGQATDIPSNFPTATFAGWGAWMRKDLIGVNGGNVDVAGSVVTVHGSLNSENMFNPEWPAGSKIYIAGSSPTCAGNLCTIASVKNSSQLTITENPGTLSNAVFQSAQSGIRAVKKTATGTANVSFNFDIAWAATLGGIADKGCSRILAPTDVDAEGNPAPRQYGSLCMVSIPESGSVTLYFFIPATGEVRLISRLEALWTGWPPTYFNMNMQGDDYVGGGAALGFLAFDKSDPKKLYVSTAISASPANLNVLLEGTYTGDFRAYVPGFNGPTTAGDDKISWLNLMPHATGHDPTAILTAAAPQYDPSFMGNAYIQGIIDGRYAIVWASQGQNMLAVAASYDLQTQQVMGVWDTWSTYPIRWGTAHAGFGLEADTWSGFDTTIMGREGGSYLNGNFDAAVDQVWKNGAWSSDTSMDYTYADACPSDLDQKWKDLGAVGQNCAQIRLHGEPCSSRPVAGEAAAHPCPWDASKSLLQTVAEGDLFTGYDSHITDGTGEHFRIVRKTVNSSTDIVLWVQRFYNSYWWEGMGDYYYGHRNGWTARMMPGGGGTTTWMDMSGVDKTVVLSVASDGGGHYTVGPGVSPNTYTYVNSDPYPVKLNLGFPALPVAAPTSISANSGTTFAGVLTDNVPIESYAVLSQWTAPASEKVWFGDFRAYQNTDGAPWETPLSLIANTVTLVSGTVQTYKVSIPNVTAVDIKRGSLVGWAGRYNFRDISNATTSSHQIDDTKPWTYCYAFKTGECRTDSGAGDAFMVVPHADLSSELGTSQHCYTNNITGTWPCLLQAVPWGGSLIQYGMNKPGQYLDNYRKLTMGLSGPGRQYTYSSWKPTPDGGWGIFRGYWPDGHRFDEFLMKLPPWPGGDTLTRDDFVQIPVKAAGGTGDGIRVRFGYAENGPPGSLYCTSRQESCATDGTGAAPFLFNSETQHYTACGNGCTVSVPAISGRMLYYQVERESSGTIGNLQVVAVP